MIRHTSALDFWAPEHGHVYPGALSLTPLLASLRAVECMRRPLVKRVLDIFVSLLVLAFTLPLLVAAAAAVRIESPGPVFRRVEKVGLGGRCFHLLGLRSAPPDAGADGGSGRTDRDKPHTICVGRLIRLTRIDEIPRLLNVLKGDMSLVGPSPQHPLLVARFARAIPGYLDRYAVKPGLTGPAQLDGADADTLDGARRMLARDLDYVAHGGLRLDLVLLGRTLHRALRPNPAARSRGGARARRHLPARTRQ